MPKVVVCMCYPVVNWCEVRIKAKAKRHFVLRRHPNGHECPLARSRRCIEYTLPSCQAMSTLYRMRAISLRNRVGCMETSQGEILPDAWPCTLYRAHHSGQFWPTDGMERCTSGHGVYLFFGGGGGITLGICRPGPR